MKTQVIRFTDFKDVNMSAQPAVNFAGKVRLHHCVDLVLPINCFHHITGLDYFPPSDVSTWHQPSSIVYKMLGIEQIRLMVLLQKCLLSMLRDGFVRWQYSVCAGSKAWKCKELSGEQDDSSFKV